MKQPYMNDKKHRLERILAARPPKKLAGGDHLILHHALRCLCNKCGKIMHWESDNGSTSLCATCCNTKYKLITWTVKVEVEEVSDDAILPRLNDSIFSDPSIDLSDYVIGSDAGVKTFFTKPLSEKQLPRRPEKYDVSPTDDPLPPQRLVAKSYNRSRRCSICKDTGHNKRNCKAYK